MDTLSMCRICLKEDIRLRLIVNTHLQEMYESLTMLSLETKDSRPLLVCYICSAKLENCYKLRKHCIQSEELLTQMLNNDLLMPAEFKPVTETNTLGMTSITHFSIGSMLESDTTACEPEVKTFDFSQVIVKVEKTDDSEEDPFDDENDDVMAPRPGAIDPLVLVKTEIAEDNTDGQEYEQSSSGNLKYPEVSTSKNVQKTEYIEVTIEAMKEQDTPIIADNTRSKNKQQCFNNVNLYDVTKYKTALDEYNKKKSVSDSLNTLQGKVKRHTCPTCQKSFFQKKRLTVHIRTHTGEKPYQCNVCTKCFIDKSNLNKHIRTHTGEKPYQCDFCNLCFSDKSDLNEHVATHTSEEMPYRCNVCSKSFFRKSCLAAHFRTHFAKKTHECNICNKFFLNKDNLDTHIRTHAIERPFKCSYCGKIYSSKSTLTRHIRMHIGDKPYQCSLCPKSFTLKNYLSRHIRVHTNDKPYQCNVCEKSFIDKSHLNRHVLIHSNISRTKVSSENLDFTTSIFNTVSSEGMSVSSQCDPQVF